MGVRSLRSSISLSLAVHAFFLLFCGVLLTRNPTAPLAPPHLTWVEVEPLPSAKKASDDKPRTRNQIVQTKRGEETEKAPDNAFLGERNQKVDRETVNRQQTIAIGQTQAPPQARQEPRAKNLTEKPRPKTAADLTRIEAFHELGVAVIPKVAPPAHTMPSEQAYRRWAENPITGQAPQDYIRGLTESEQTALSTKEFVYFGYYQRIRERLDRAWVPILRERLLAYYRTGRRLASDMDHSTRVLVILNTEGEIVRVKIVGESGTRDLDEAAVKAFNRAGPFPNPPHGIIDPEGQIEIPWEFILKT